MTVPRRWSYLLLVKVLCIEVLLAFWKLTIFSGTKARPGMILNNLVIDSWWLCLVGMGLGFHTWKLILCREFRPMNKPGIVSNSSLNANGFQPNMLSAPRNHSVLKDGSGGHLLTGNWAITEIHPSWTSKGDGYWDRWALFLWHNLFSTIST